MAPAQDYRCLAAALILAALCGSGSSFLCPPDYYAIETRCFKFVTEPYTWEAAEANCAAEGHGGTLAQGLDQDTHALAALIFYLQNNPQLNDTRIWLGGSDIAVEGQWRWGNGAYVSRNPLFWHHKQPNDYRDTTHPEGEDCLELRYSSNQYKFNDNFCSETISSLCSAPHWPASYKFDQY